MIPFKLITNSILKNTAVLMILLSISESCFSYLQDSRRTTNDFQRQVDAKDLYGRSATSVQRETVEISPYIRDVRADSRQSRIDARDIRTDFREIRTELPNVARRGHQQETRLIRESGSFRDVNNNIRNTESSKIGRETIRDRRNTRHVRDNSRQQQNYSPHRNQRQLLGERIRDFSRERRDFSAMRTSGELVEERSQENGNRRQSQIRSSEDQRGIREESRDFIETRERSDERRFDRKLHHRRQDSRNLRNVQARFDSRRIQRESKERLNDRQFRNVQRYRDNKRATSRDNERIFESPARRDVGERRSRDVREQHIRQEYRGMRDMVLDNRQRRNIRESSQTRRRSIRECSVVQDEIQGSPQKLQNIRIDNRRDPEHSKILRERRNNIQLSRNRKDSQDERSRIGNVREWSRTLRESSELSNNRQRIVERRESRSALREKREIGREHPRDRREYSHRVQEDRNDATLERNSLLADRRSDESRTRREDSRQRMERQETLDILRDRREIAGERDDVRNSRRIMLQRDDLERQEHHLGERRETVPDTRKIDTSRVTGVDSRKDLKDFETKIINPEALRNVDFIPNLKEKTDLLSNTLQMVLIVALFGQIFFSTSKNNLRFANLYNFLGKEKIL